ncbi:hypothetical protein SETIT_7G143200v2, partial [Setaria italica]|uniref:F-box domain-containing protein n=1 Tax=Setaria italica TaxID=4555 RepID=K3YEL1_SETIT
LPNDILLSILERLQLREAVRTSILSTRWMHLFSIRSRIVVDVAAFHCKDDKGSMFTPATKSMSARSSQYPISLLRIRFHLVEESIDIIHCVDGTLANRKISAVHFLILPEQRDRRCTEDELATNGRHFMRFVYAGSHASASLSYLHIRCFLMLIICYIHARSWSTSSFRVANVGLNLYVLRIEHPHLTTLALDGCVFGKIELSWLPRLKCFSYRTWYLSQDQYPLSLGYVPQLSTLKLRNEASIMHKTIRLSELLGNATISSLDLNFDSERIWIESEAPKVLGPLFQNLQILSLQCIHEECDLDWTMFFLEAAPLLNQIFIKVWDHTPSVPNCRPFQLLGDTCNIREEEYGEWQDVYQKGYNLPMWEAPADLKHCNLKELIIKGYQVEEKFRYIRRLVKAAVNLEVIVLIHSGSCEYCKFSPSTRYPWTQEERLQIKEQILEWRSSPIKLLGFESLECRPSHVK